MRLKRRVYEKVFNEVPPAAVINTPGTCSSQLLAAVFVRRAQPIYTYIRSTYLLFPFNQLQPLSLRRIVVTTLLSLAGDTILMNRPRARNHRARNSPRCAARARVSVLRNDGRRMTGSSSVTTGTDGMVFLGRAEWPLREHGIYNRSI